MRVLKWFGHPTFWVECTWKVRESIGVVFCKVENIYLHISLSFQVKSAIRRSIFSAYDSVSVDVKLSYFSSTRLLLDLNIWLLMSTLYFVFRHYTLDISHIRNCSYYKPPKKLIIEELRNSCSSFYCVCIIEVC